MTSSNGNIFRVTGLLCAENSPVIGEFSAQWLVSRSFDVFFDPCLNKRFSKQSRGLWFETPSCLLWRNCNETKLLVCWDVLIPGKLWSASCLLWKWKKKYSITHLRRMRIYCTGLFQFIFYAERDVFFISIYVMFDILPIQILNWIVHLKPYNSYFNVMFLLEILLRNKMTQFYER